MLTILEKYLICRLEFIRQIQDFLPDQFSKEEKETSDLLKQLADYDFSAQTVRKIEQKYYKKWSSHCLHLSAVTQIHWHRDLPHLCR